ncbi:terpene synthase family protein [Streptomyces sp. NBC_00454]|uniref:terpene synthase family protein n=1 Tax=Streptomyces sp. NBC_00454 TaxID=2975747 RepID=UPI0030E21E7F
MDAPSLNGLVWPTWHIPFPHRQNPVVDQVEAAHLEWMDRFALAPTTKAMEHYRKARNVEGNAWFYPTASLEDLILLTNMMGWFWIFDDQFDDGQTGLDVAKAKTIASGIIPILYGAPAPAGSPAPYQGLADVVQGFGRRLGPDSMRRLGRGISQFMLAYIWETENRSARRFPTLREYIHMRVHSGCVVPVYDVVELAENVSLPYRLRESVWMNDFLFDAANIINWQNDVVSLVKESNQHHVNNLVYILQNQNGCSLQEAVDTAYGMATGLNEKIFRAQRELPGMMDIFRLDDTERDGVQRWFDGVLLALGGCMKWHEITHNRYLRYTTALDDIDRGAPGANPAYLADLLPNERIHPGGAPV